MEGGEHRLLRAVEAGQMPVSVAVLIAQAEDDDIQNVLQQAYEDKLLRGQRLLAAKKLIEQRRRRGKGYKTGPRRAERRAAVLECAAAGLSPGCRSQEGPDPQIQQHQGAADLILEALRKLLTEPDFLAILEHEKLDTLPKNLALRLQGQGYMARRPHIAVRMGFEGRTSIVRLADRPSGADDLDLVLSDRLSRQSCCVTARSSAIIAKNFSGSVRIPAHYRGGGAGGDERAFHRILFKGCGLG